jgi:hypothetical protein
VAIEKRTPYPLDMTRYARDKRINSDMKRAQQSRLTAERAQNFMRDYGTASTYGNRPRLQTRNSEKFNSKPGGRRPRGSRQALANRRWGMDQRAWNEGRRQAW